MKTKPLHIAVFSGELPSTSFVERLIQGVSLKHRVVLFGVKDRSSKLNYNSNVKIYTTPKHKIQNLIITIYRGFKLSMSRPLDLIALWKEVKRFPKTYDRWIWLTKFLPIILYKPDVLHLQWTRDLEFYTFFKTKFHIPLVVSFRGAHINYTPIVEPYMAQVYQNTFPYVDAFHAVSKTIATEASKYGRIADRTTVIHSPLPSLFINQFSESESIKPDEVIHIVSVGRLHWKKGFSYALKAISLLKIKGYKIHYSIVGASEPNEELRYLIHDLNLHDSVFFLNSISQLDVVTFLKTQDLMLLPSVEEGIANVVLEAMAVGLPVVSTNCGGMAEVIVPKTTGWLVPLRNSEAMVEAIIELINMQPSDLNKITKSAYEFVKEAFNYELSINKFIALYESITRSSEN